MGRIVHNVLCMAIDLHPMHLQLLYALQATACAQVLFASLFDRAGAGAQDDGPGDEAHQVLAYSGVRCAWRYHVAMLCAVLCCTVLCVTIEHACGKQLWCRGTGVL